MIWALLLNCACISLQLWTEWGMKKGWVQDIHSSDVDQGREASSQSQQPWWWLSDVASGSGDSLALSKACSSGTSTISPCTGDSTLGSWVLRGSFRRCSSQWCYELHTPFNETLSAYARQGGVCGLHCGLHLKILSDMHNIYRSALSADSVFPNLSIHNVWDTDFQKRAPTLPLSSRLFWCLSPHSSLTLHKLRKWTALQPSNRF